MKTIRDLFLELELLKTELAKKEEENQLLKEKLYQAKLDYDSLYDLYQEKVKELDEL